MINEVARSVRYFGGERLRLFGYFSRTYFVSSEGLDGWEQWEDNLGFWRTMEETQQAHGTVCVREREEARRTTSGLKSVFGDSQGVVVRDDRNWSSDMKPQHGDNSRNPVKD